jgi:hypothetical protein
MIRVRLVLPDQRRSVVGASPICVNYLSFLVSISLQHFGYYIHKFFTWSHMLVMGIYAQVRPIEPHVSKNVCSSFLDRHIKLWFMLKCANRDCVF